MIWPGKEKSKEEKEKETSPLPAKNFSTGPEDLLAYGFDSSGRTGRPSAVAWPQSAGEVAKVLKHARENGMKVVPRGTGTGMSGGAVPVASQAGISPSLLVLSMERMNRLLDIDSSNLTVTVEPGMINGRLQRELSVYGLFYPPDPTSMEFCTLGGNVAENAGGPRALKYGVTADYILELEAVLPSGEIIKTGAGTRKSVVGYNLAKLLTGSEGTLAVITKIKLKVLPIPQEIITLLAVFDSAESAGHAVSSIIAGGTIPRTLEIMDRASISAVEHYSPTGLPHNAGALLLIELDGHPNTIRDEAGKIVDVCSKLDAEVTMAEDEFAKDALWKARRSLSPALYNFCPRKLSEDIVVPPSRIPEMLASISNISGKHGVPMAAFGHAGDGNLHVNILPEDLSQGASNITALITDLFARTLELGGSISGEHGIGLTKKDYIGMEISPAVMELMRGIKRTFDPEGLLNPGKIFPKEP